jgi:VPDSG-CTERM motif
VSPKLGDFLLTYTVTATSGKITSIDQSYAGDVSNGIGTISVTETVKNAAFVVVANSCLSIGDTSDPFAEAGDVLAINPGESVLFVVKDINLAILANPDQLGVTTISDVQQSFHQNQTVPDGGSAISLLGIALLGLEGLRGKTRTIQTV